MPKFKLLIGFRGEEIIAELIEEARVGKWEAIEGELYAGEGDETVMLSDVLERSVGLLMD